jgi:hypothetical protein
MALKLAEKLTGRQEVSAHEFTRAVKGFFSMCGFSRGEFFKTLAWNVEFFSKLFSCAANAARCG